MPKMILIAYNRYLNETRHGANLTFHYFVQKVIDEDGIAGAQATAGVIFFVRNGASKDELKAYMEKYYPVDFTIDEIRPTYEYEIINKTTVPQAFQCFYEAMSMAMAREDI